MIVSCIPPDYSIASAPLAQVQIRTMRHPSSLRNELLIRFQVCKLALYAVADFFIHLSMAALKLARTVMEIPLTAIGKDYSPRVTALDAGSHLSRSVRSAWALIPTVTALIYPKLALSTYRWLALGSTEVGLLSHVRAAASKAWYSPRRNKIIVATAALTGAVLGYLTSRCVTHKDPLKDRPITIIDRTPNRYPESEELTDAQKVLNVAVLLVSLTGLSWIMPGD